MFKDAEDVVQRIDRERETSLWQIRPQHAVRSERDSGNFVSNVYGALSVKLLTKHYYLSKKSLTHPTV